MRDNHYWPALYFVDAGGIIRDSYFGEGRYEESERVIQELLGVERELVSVEGQGKRSVYEFPERLLFSQWALNGEWTGLLRDGRMYQLLREHDAVRERILEITFLEPGADAYAFTFG